MEKDIKIYGNVEVNNRLEGLEYNQIQLEYYKIYNSAKTGGTNKTTFGSEVTTFTAISGENERVLNSAPDDYGTSYYFRGNVLDNYVSFADKIWRIVRINGDGTVRLVLDDVAKDSSGNVIAQFTPAVSFQSVLISTPDITSDGTYTLSIGDSTQEITMSGYIYGNSMGGFGGGRPGGMGGGTRRGPVRCG